jgi:hypothetical protein
MLLLAFDAADRYLRAAARLHISGVAFSGNDDTFPPSVVADLGPALNNTWVAYQVKPLSLTSDAGVKKFLADMKYASVPPVKNWALPTLGEEQYVAIQVAAHVASTLPNVTAKTMMSGLEHLNGYKTALSAPQQFVHPITSYPGITRLFNANYTFMRFSNGRLVPANPGGGSGVQWVDVVRPVSAP